MVCDEYSRHLEQDICLVDEKFQSQQPSDLKIFEVFFEKFLKNAVGQSV